MAVFLPVLSKSFLPLTVTGTLPGGCVWAWPVVLFDLSFLGPFTLRFRACASCSFWPSQMREHSCDLRALSNHSAPEWNLMVHTCMVVGMWMGWMMKRASSMIQTLQPVYFEVVPASCPTETDSLLDDWMPLITCPRFASRFVSSAILYRLGFLLAVLCTFFFSTITSCVMKVSILDLLIDARHHNFSCCSKWNYELHWWIFLLDLVLLEYFYTCLP